MGGLYCVLWIWRILRATFSEVSVSLSAADSGYLEHSIDADYAYALSQRRLEGTTRKDQNHERAVANNRVLPRQIQAWAASWYPPSHYARAKS